MADELTPIQELIGLALEQKPSDFTSLVQDIIRDRAAIVIDNVRQGMVSEAFGKDEPDDEEDDGSEDEDNGVTAGEEDEKLSEIFSLDESEWTDEDYDYLEEAMRKDKLPGYHKWHDDLSSHHASKVSDRFHDHGGTDDEEEHYHQATRHAEKADRAASLMDRAKSGKALRAAQAAHKTTVHQSRVSNPDHGKYRHMKKPFGEETEQLDELSKMKLQKYSRLARGSKKDRTKGIALAQDKLKTEENIPPTGKKVLADHGKTISDPSTKTAPTLKQGKNGSVKGNAKTPEQKSVSVASADTFRTQEAAK
jgi:hypothetical protein